MHPLHHPHFVNFIVYFNNNQDFFECHEVLEDYWKAQPQFSKAHPLTAYILLAVGLYHWRRKNLVGAVKLLTKATHRMAPFLNGSSPFTEGIDFPTLYQQCKESMHAVERGEAFQSFTIQITSPSLQALYEEAQSTLPLLPKNSIDIIDKHRTNRQSLSEDTTDID